MNTAVTSRLSRWVAAFIAMALVFGGSILVTSPASAAPVTGSPAITFTPNTGVDPAVENTFTVSGTGFTGAGALYGAYVNVGAESAWTPGTVPDATKFVKTVWVMPASIVDGEFSANITVDAGKFDGSVKYGVSTFAAHGLSITDRTLDTYAPITFKPVVPVANPVVTVTPNSNIDPAVANSFTVTGTGFFGAGAASGAYVNVGAESAWTPGTVPDATKFVKTVWVMPASIVDGAFSANIAVDAGKFDGSVKYGVSTFAAHGLSVTNRTLDTYTPITFKPVVTPVITVTPNSNIDPAVANTLTVSGTGFTGAGALYGAYVNVGAESAWTPGTVPDATKFVKTVWVMPSSIVAGAFTVNVPLDAGKLDGSVKYGVSTFAAHGLSVTDRTLDTYVPIAVKASVIPAKPVVTVTPSSDIDPAVANNLTVSGTGFTGAGALYGAYVNVGAESVWTPGTVPDASKFVTTVWVRPASIVDGSFTVSVPLAAGALDGSVTYGVSTFAAHGLSVTDRTLDSYTPIALRAPVLIPTSLSLSSAPENGAEVGAPVTLSASVSPSVAGTITFFTGSTRVGSAPVTPISSRGTVVVDGLAAGTVSFRAEFTPGAPLVYGSSEAAISFVVSPKPIVGAGSFTWGVKQSFRDYITGTIAKGAIATTGVSTSGGQFTFGQSTGGSYDRATAAGTSNYSGSVRFTGHEGVLDVTFANPIVRVDSASSATLIVNVNGSAVPLASLNLAAGSLSTPNNTVSYSRVPATLTSQGVSAFALNGSGFYEAGTALDPVSFVIGAPSLTSTATGATVASFVAPRTPAATPPATTGLEIAQGTALSEGSEVTITASGFQPNETGILVVIYSEPTVLAKNATADAAGVVTWTGKLPAGLTGQHTLTLQGSVNRGVEVTIAAASTTTTAAGCLVDDATITWGFKESFRAYISGSIAHGEWTVTDGATYAVPNFGFANGAGSYDDESGAGLVEFAGAITFTGHGGVLNTTVANPQLRFDNADTAYLLVDLSGTTQDGTPVDSKAVEFAKIDLAGVLENNGGAVTITSAPATLTAAGAAGFGTYPEGEALDPITVVFTTADCAEAMSTTAEPRGKTEVEKVSADEPTDFGWIVWVTIALIVIAAVVTVLVLRRRRAKA